MPKGRGNPIELRALELATQALSECKIGKDLCNERNADVKNAHEEIRNGQVRIHDRIDALATRWFAVAGVTIVVLLSATGVLLAKLLGL